MNKDLAESNKELCPCGMSQSYPIPHEHDRTEREVRIIEAVKKETLAHVLTVIDRWCVKQTNKVYMQGLTQEQIQKGTDKLLISDNLLKSHINDLKKELTALIDNSVPEKAVQNDSPHE